MYTVKDNGRSVHHVVLELQFVLVLSMIRFVGDLIVHAGTFCLFITKDPYIQNIQSAERQYKNEFLQVFGDIEA